MYRYDLIIIGAGSGGLVAAEFAAMLGVSVALIEAQADLGGECLHTGCVPSKALINAARVAWSAGHSESLGIHAKPQVNFLAVKRHIETSIQKITDSHDNDGYYQKLGVEVIHGRAEFLNRDTIRVNNKELRAKRFIIATGSRPAVPNIAGLENGNYLTNETIFQLKELPESLLIIGGGPIGCELGQAFAMLGSHVTILQAAPRLLPRDEVEASILLTNSLKSMGITLELNAQINRVSYTNKAVSVWLKDGVEVTAAKLMVATGRKANIPHGLENAGVNINERGITVNNQLKTSNKHFYAIGDCNGGIQFTHSAGQQAIIAVQNALIGLRKSFDSSKIPWTTFTTPEIAHLGAIKAELDSKNIFYKIVRVDFQDIDKAITEKEDGFIEILIGNKQNILGATIVGANAAEILAQIVVAKSWDSFKGIIQAYPTYAGGLKQATASFNLNHLLNSNSGKILQKYIKLRSRL